MGSPVELYLITSSPIPLVEPVVLDHVLIGSNKSPTAFIAFCGDDGNSSVAPARVNFRDDCTGPPSLGLHPMKSLQPPSSFAKRLGYRHRGFQH